jgi:hypothetical protein
MQWLIGYQIGFLRQLLTSLGQSCKGDETNWRRLTTTEFLFCVKGQLSAHSSRLRRVQGRIRPLWVLCMQSFPAFL